MLSAPAAMPGENKLLVLLSASVERFGVSHMGDSFWTLRSILGNSFGPLSWYLLLIVIPCSPQRQHSIGLASQQPMHGQHFWQNIAICLKFHSLLHCTPNPLSRILIEYTASHVNYCSSQHSSTARASTELMSSLCLTLENPKDRVARTAGSRGTRYSVRTLSKYVKTWPREEGHYLID